VQWFRFRAPNNNESFHEVWANREDSARECDNGRLMRHSLCYYRRHYYYYYHYSRLGVSLDDGSCGAMSGAANDNAFKYRSAK